MPAVSDVMTSFEKCITDHDSLTPLKRQSPKYTDGIANSSNCDLMEPLPEA